jgi:hypothetical protein
MFFGKSKLLYGARFEVLTAVVMKSSVFWDITPCNPVKVNRRSGGTCLALRCFNCCLLHAGVLFGLLFKPEDGGDMFRRIVG